MDTLFLEEFRCDCGKLLLKGIFLGGTLEVKCSRCGSMNRIGTLKSLSGSTNYILIINNRGIITNLSDSVSNILGYSSTELIGQPFNIVNPAVSLKMEEKYFSQLSSKDHLHFNTAHQTKNGQKVPVEVTLRLYHSLSKNNYLLLSAKVKKNNSGQV